MGAKLAWTGLAFILALLPVLDALGLHGSNVITLAGAIIMIVGVVLMWMDR